MAGKGKDYFGIASSQFERINRSKEAKERTTIPNESLKDQIAKVEERREALKNEEKAKKASEQAEVDRINSLRIIMPAGSREAWLKNKEIIQAKAEKRYTKPDKEEVKLKDVEFLEASYGTEDIQVSVDIKLLEQGLKVTNKLVDKDPVKNVKKSLFILAIVDGTEGEYEFPERKKIRF